MSDFLAGERARAVIEWTAKLAAVETDELLGTAQGALKVQGMFPRGSVSAEHQGDLMAVMRAEMIRRGLIPADDEEGEGGT